nr:nuclear poly(A) polymerase 2-like isoform X1 [Ipomoea batatas]
MAESRDIDFERFERWFERAQPHPLSPEEGGSAPGRRPGKEPTVDDHLEVHDLADEEEGLGENNPVFQADPRAAGRHWAPKRSLLEKPLGAFKRGPKDHEGPSIVS